MPGNAVEINKFTVMFLADSRTATGILFNDNATGAVGIDTRDYDEATVVINAGAFASAATAAFDLYANSTDDAETATAITGASFGSIAAANDNALHIGRVAMKSQSRYLYLRVNKTANTNAADYSAEVILSTADKSPATNSETFSV